MTRPWLQQLRGCPPRRPSGPWLEALQVGTAPHQASRAWRRCWAPRRLGLPRSVRQAVAEPAAGVLLPEHTAPPAPAAAAAASMAAATAAGELPPAPPQLRRLLVPRLATPPGAPLCRTRAASWKHWAPSRAAATAGARRWQLPCRERRPALRRCIEAPAWQPWAAADLQTDRLSGLAAALSAAAARAAAAAAPVAAAAAVAAGAAAPPTAAHRPAAHPAPRLAAGALAWAPSNPAPTAGRR